MPKWFRCLFQNTRPLPFAVVAVSVMTWSFTSGFAFQCSHTLGCNRLAMAHFIVALGNPGALGLPLGRSGGARGLLLARWVLLGGGLSPLPLASSLARSLLEYVFFLLSVSLSV